MCLAHVLPPQLGLDPLRCVSTGVCVCVSSACLTPSAGAGSINMCEYRSVCVSSQ